MRLNDKQLAAWRTTRRHGKRRFIVVEWMVYWGLPTGMMWSVAMTILERGFSNILSESFVIQSLIASILFPVGGFLRWIVDLDTLGTSISGTNQDQSDYQTQQSYWPNLTTHAVLRASQLGRNA